MQEYQKSPFYRLTSRDVGCKKTRSPKLITLQTVHIYFVCPNHQKKRLQRQLLASDAICGAILSKNGHKVVGVVKPQQPTVVGLTCSNHCSPPVLPTRPDVESEAQDGADHGHQSLGFREGIRQQMGGVTTTHSVLIYSQCDAHYSPNSGFGLMLGCLVCD